MLIGSGHQNGFSIVPRRFSYFIRREIIALRIAVATIWFALCAATMISFSAAAQDIPPLSPELHPWGKFEPGAWKRIHVVTETFNEQGTIASTNLTDSKTTLFDIDDESLTLETQACVEMAGKRFDSEPQIGQAGFSRRSAFAEFEAQGIHRRTGGNRRPQNPLPGVEARIDQRHRQNRDDDLLLRHGSCRIFSSAKAKPPIWKAKPCFPKRRPRCFRSICRLSFKARFAWSRI